MTAAGTIKLYDLAGRDPAVRFSPFCWRAKMALAHKGLPFEAVPWRFTDKEAIKASGQGLVPVILVDGGAVLHDSWRIACHLDDAHPDLPTLMGRVLGRAHAVLAKHWVERAIHPLVSRLVILDILACLDERDAAYFRQSREARFGTSLERWRVPPEEGVPALRAALAPARATFEEQPYLGGEKPSYPDYCLFGAFMWAYCVSPVELLAEDDPVHAWRERLLDAFDGLARNAARAKG